MGLLELALENRELVVLVFVSASLLAFLLPSKVRLILNGFLLWTVSFIYYFQDTHLIYSRIAASNFGPLVVGFAIASTATSLIKDSMAEKGGILSKISLITGIFLLILIGVPKLYVTGSINFTLPGMTDKFLAIIYLFGGGIGILAALIDDHE
jgi:hypothetical protein